MDPASKVNPILVLNLRKTLSKCGRSQGSQETGLLETEQPIHGKGVSEIPVDPKKNIDVLNNYRKKFSMPKASDVEIIGEIANQRVSNCEKKNTRFPSLHGFAENHAIDAYKPAGSEMVHIRITRK